jgi:hypothetical protein
LLSRALMVPPHSGHSLVPGMILVHGNTRALS